MAIKQLTVKNLVSELGHINSIKTYSSDSDTTRKQNAQKTLDLLKSLDKEVSILNTLHSPKVSNIKYN